MRILFTGASSFTGLVFVKSLVAAGHEVICPLRKSLEEYEGVRRQRVEQLVRSARLRSKITFGSKEFLELLREEKSWDLLCHHASEAANYKSADFDPFVALQNNGRNLRNVLETFRERGGKAVLLTGTVFEPNEGTGEEPLRAFSPYGLSKGLTWQTFQYYCAAANVPLGKFVIPNPFGPWEEPRFTAYLMNTWKEGKTAAIRTPDYVRDNIHVDLLAAVYVRFASRLAKTSAGCIKANPSGYVETQAAFGLRVAHEVRTRAGWPCGLEMMTQKDFSEPQARGNLQPAAKEIPEWNEQLAWNAFVEFYASRA